MRPRHLWVWVCAALTLPACGESDGIVEVYWEFNDAKLRRIYPVGAELDTCEFTGLDGRRYDLRVRLTIAENSETCAADWTQPDCEIIEPILFPCNRSRGTALSVPVSANADDTDPGYLMVVEAMVDPTDVEPFVPISTCLSQPGPRVRAVRPGRITDLEIYEFIVLGLNLDGGLLDLQACAPVEP